MEAFSGYLTIKVKSGLLKNKTYTNCWCILYPGKNDFPPHLDVYEDQNRIEPGLCKKSLDIVNAKWANAETAEPAFGITVKGKCYVFYTKSHEDCIIWCQCLCCLSRDLFSSRQAKNAMPNEGDIVMQDNVLYASSNDMSQFDVVADQSQEVCARFGLSGILRLSVDSTGINIFQQSSPHPVIEWKHHDIRNYGSSDYCVSITSGKKSSTGECRFKFSTTEGSEIVKQIGFHTLRLKDQATIEQVTAPSLSRDETRLNSLSSNPSSSSATKKKPAPGIPTPKPISPAISSSPGSVSSNAFDSQFKKQLNIAISAPVPPAERGKNLLEPKKSHSLKSSNESLSKKDMKKNAKEKSKLAKQQKLEKKKEAKLEKKEREKQLLEKKEKEKQLEKLKKGRGKGKPPVPNDDDLTNVENMYSEATDSQIPEPIMDGDYAECEFQSKNIATRRDTESKVYNDPWGLLPLHLPTNVEEDDDDEDQDTYATPIKHNRGNKNNPQIIGESYEDVSPISAPIIHPKLEALGEDDSNNNVYDHFAGVTPNSQETPENIYGLESAKSLASNYESNGHTDVLYSDCTYETVG